MKRRWNMGIVALAAMILTFAVPAMAEEDSSGHVGSSSAISSYYEQVRSGERELYNKKTDEDTLEGAREAALASYENLGIVDIGSGYLNVREEPSEMSLVIGKMLDGYAGEIIDENEEWYQISSGSVEGWVSKEYFLSGEEAQQKALEVMDLRVQVTTDTLNVRTEPSESSRMWTQINQRERYPVVEDLGDWIEIELDTSVGYIKSEYVDVRYTLEKAVEIIVDPSTALRNRMVNFALQYLGNPYVWGGESLTDGCDCSGYVMLIFQEFGLTDLPHYSVAQSEMGWEISFDEIEPGDLIFYADQNGTINHVTMYIGDEYVVGAQSKRDGIRIRSWDYRTPVMIRRYFE